MPLFFCAASAGAVEEMSIPEALVFSLISMLVVFSLLALLWGVVSIMKFFCYTLPNRKKAAAAQAPAQAPAGGESAPEIAAAPIAPAPPAAEQGETQDEAELVAVFAAAIAALEGTSPSGFVVRSFRRADRAAWTGAGRREAVDGTGL